MSTDFWGEVNTSTAVLMGALGAAVLGLRRILTGWATGKSEASKAMAEVDIVEQLRSEVARLADQNDKLAKTVNELQLQLIEVRRENADLKALIDRLTNSRH